ncbi:MAG: hypothetical protein U0Q47_02085 [Mycobacterium sp.]
MRPLKVSTSNDHDIEAMLRRIGRRVFDDVWISRRVRVFAGVLVAVLAGAAVFGWADTHQRHVTATPGVAVCAVALMFFTMTSVLSSIALLRSCFRWCTAAAYGSGLGTVAGLGVVWWHQTTPNTQCPGPCGWMVVGVLCSAALVLTWLRLILTPLEKSQPDIRVGSAL